MQFQSRVPNQTVIVNPKYYAHNQFGQKTGLVPGHIKARFADHFFDSEVMRERLGWTEEQEEAVIAKLIELSEKGEDGIYPVDHATAGKFSPKVPEQTGDFCITSIQGEKGKPPRICAKPVVKGPNVFHCEDHLQPEEKVTLGLELTEKEKASLEAVGA